MLRLLRAKRGKRHGFIRDRLLPTLGLNNENIHEQSAALHSQLGGGFRWRIWQYPHQFERYLRFLVTECGELNSYLEIGSRFGGTFTLTCEFLANFNPGFSHAMAVDLIPLPDLLAEYRSIRHFEYFMGDSTTGAFLASIGDRRFELTLIDGDHMIDGVLADFANIRQKASVLVLHDIVSSAHNCTGTFHFWKCAKAFLPGYKFAEFTEQYPDVPAGKPFLGIGVMVPMQ